MTRGQRIFLWVAGVPAILVGLTLLVEGGQCPELTRRSPACMSAEGLVLTAMMLGGGLLALFKAMSRQ
jgi:hypothetical protein